ncbi:hypothetical protein [Acidovorax sp. SUPP2825]|uniref:hypothetical protein n=1 Tax=Acidovorax sp. SUPP2825 TaxID=2920879 RepID=UPI0023DE410E|nr:hypothetical protein [Acidovorax sp. SUPP2825]GKS97661.1 hypothetical protein AVAK2825_24020 [Acidovorax sp. SUPP2825]
MEKLITQSSADIEALAHLNLAVVRILVAKGLVQKEELFAELPRHQPHEAVAFALHRLISNLPEC